MDNIIFLKEKANELPILPGVYIMKNSLGKIIYIGKAKKLKNRVSQYFKNIEKHDVKVYKMVLAIKDFDYIITDSEFEALILECSLIKHNMPKYNILLKDDKGYNYIEVTNEIYPKIRAVFQKDEKSNNKYIGPFTSSSVVKNTVLTVNDIFMLPTCNKKFPRDFKKERPCLNYYIKKCAGICKGEINEKDY
ncbi:MAG: GIY-YIG nuclease family protein, partial [Oscillospiraceae bacterium]